MKRALIGAGLVVVVVFGGVLVAWRLLVRDDVRALSVDEATQKFRTEGTTAAEPGTGGPARGVYVYETSGFESIDALGGARHDLPAETTIEVKDGGCGLLITWQPLAEVSTEREVCPEPGGGWRVARMVTRHEFFGQDDRREFDCGSDSIDRPASNEPGTTWTTRCVAGELVSSTEGVVVGTESVKVGDRTLETVHLRVKGTNSGESTGQSTTDAWISTADNLLVRQVTQGRSTTGTPIGDVNFTERYELKLTDANPRS